MPAQPRKKPTAAVAARREVRAEMVRNPNAKAAAKPVAVQFRGATFEVARDRAGSARVFMRQRHFDQFRTVDSLVALLFEILGQVDSGRFISLCTAGDSIDGAATEFLAALNKANNVPNS